MIKVKDLVKVIDRRIILDNINFEIPKGSICGLVGRNGAGKTSLLNCILGLWSKDHGTILIDELNIENNNQFKKFTAFIPDKMNIPNTLRVKEAMKLYELGFDEFDKIYFKNLIEKFKINMMSRIDELSKGTSLKLLIALNLARHPDVIILDEPFANLDPISRKELINILILCSIKKQITIIISTHNILNVEKFCDLFIVMDNGKVIDIGTTEDIRRKVQKISIIFNNEIPQWFIERRFENQKFRNLNQNILDYKVIGNMVLIVINNYSEKILNELNQIDNILIELQTIDLEEVIVYLLGGKLLEEYIE